MSWETVRLGDICHSISDGDHQAPPKTGEGVPFVTISNITSQNQLDFRNTMFVPQVYYECLDVKRRAQKGDILYSVVGSFGIPVFMRNAAEFVFQRHIAILRPNTKKIVPAYLYYVMAIGAAQRTVTLTALRNIEIAVPTMDKQETIAEILSAYDKIIDNNRRQIALLEEAAQRLYREWFVDLRFPGYENTKTVDGVPEGWREQFIGSVFEIRYGKTLPTNKISRVGKYPVYGANGVIGYYVEKNCDNHAVLITSRGNGSGDVLRTHDKESFVTNNSFVVKPFDKSYHIPYVYQLMKHTDFKRIRTGSAQPQLTNSSINTLSVLVPSDEVVRVFCNRADSWYEKIESLLKQNKLLSEARDRLLPKLMSGEIAV